MTSQYKYGERRHGVRYSPPPPRKISKQLSEYTKHFYKANLQHKHKATQSKFTAHTIAFTRTNFVPQLNMMSLWQFARVTTSASEIRCVICQVNRPSHRSTSACRVCCVSVAVESVRRLCRRRHCNGVGKSDLV